jgi:glycosyltransferase involved in cell wall biosynthesis
MKDLAILIPTLPVRIDSYTRLIKKLCQQIERYRLQDKVQIHSYMDCKDHSVGVKRNMLIQNSSAKYVCFLDDDDDISDDYLYQIFLAIPMNCDVITFDGAYIEQGKKTRFSISRLNRNNFNAVDCFYRLPNHLCPVKREIAIASLFTDKNFGEDSDYSERINKLIKNEYHIKHDLYFYLYDQQNSQTSPSNLNKRTF